MSVDPERARFPRWIAVIFVAIGIGCLAGGYGVYRVQDAELRASAEDQVEAIGRLKAGQIADWRRERLLDSEGLLASPFFRDGVARWLANPDEAGGRDILTTFRISRDSYGYADVLLVDAQGRLRLGLDAESASVVDHTRDALRVALSERRTVMDDLIVHAGHNTPHLHIIAPLFAGESGSGDPLGAVVFVINASPYLYPLIQSWPAPSDTAETLLVRRQGDQVLYLNELRHRTGAALQLTVPVTQTGLPAVQAVLGTTGVFYGVDYRGAAVISYVTPVPDSPWYVVAKIDEDEAFAALRTRSAFITALVLALMGICGIGAALSWSSLSRERYRAAYRAQAERQALAGHIERLVKHANDIILLADGDRRLVDVNDRAVESYGYPRQELLGLTFEDLTAFAEMPVQQHFVQQAGATGSARYETLHCRKDGSEFPVEVSARTITVDGATYTQAIIRDISERRQADQALRESQERLAATLRSIGDAVIGTDAQGKVTLLNQVAESLTGWPAGEAMGRALGEVFQIISADTRQPAENPVERVLRQGAIVRLANHTVLISREGAEYQIADSGAPIRGGDGVIIGAVLVFRDVTSEYRSQQELREQEARFRAVFDNSVDALRVAKGGRLVMVNPAYLRLFGYEREEELIDLPLWDLVAPEDRQRIQEIVERRARGNEAPGVYEAHCLRRDGSTFLAEVHAGGYQAAGEYYSHAVVRDVTRQRAEEQAVREAKRLLEMTLASIQDAVLVVDPAGPTFIACNRSVETVFGYRPDEIIGSETEILHTSPESRREFTAQLSARTGPDGVAHFEWEMRRKDGTIMPCEVSIATVQDPSHTPALNVAVIRDISARKAAELSLRESEERYRQLLDASPVGVAVHSEGKIVFANPAGARILGGTPEQVVGRPIFQVIHPDSQEAARDRIRRLLAGEKGLYPTEDRYVRLDGSEVPVEVRAVPLTYQGKPAVQVIVSDISERKAAERALRESEGRFRAIFDASMDAVNVAHDGLVVMANQAWLRLYGYDSLDELVGRPVHILVAPEDRERVREIVRLRAAGEQAPSQYEMRGLRRDGSSFLAEVQAGAYAVGSERYSVAVVRDITRRRADEDGILEAKTMLERTLAGVQDGVMVVDTEQRRVISCNEAVERIFGYRCDEIVGQNTALLHVSPEAAREFTARRVAATGPDGVSHLEWEMRRKDGTVFPTEHSVAVLPEIEGKPTLVVSIVRDITARRQAEQQIKARLAELEALERTSAALREVVTVGAMLPLLARTIVDIFQADRATIWLYDRVKDEMRPAASVGWEEHNRQWPAPVCRPGKGLLGLAFSTGQVQVTREMRTDPRTSPANRELLPPGLGGASVPIRAGETIIGIFTMNVFLPRELSGDEIRLLSTISEIAGNAIWRAMLNEQTERRLQHLAALADIDRAITSNFDLRGNLATILTQVTAQLGADAAAILTYNPGTQTLDFAARRGHYNLSPERPSIRLGQGIAGRAALERRRFSVTRSDESPESAVLRTTLASEGFVVAHAVPLVARGQIRGVLEVFQRSPVERDQEWFDFMGALAEQAAIAIDNATLLDNLQRSNTDLTLAYNATIEGWSRALDLRDKETEGHTLRVTEITTALARSFGFKDDELRYIRWGALLHDIGKMGVPDGILLKPGALTEEEWVAMRKHPTFAYELLSPISYLRSALDIPYRHHEKWDGTGYPLGLKGEQIPLAARIFAVVDVWDALRSDRPYRPAWPAEKVLEHIRSLAGTHFDPEVVRVCVDSDVFREEASR